MFNEDRLKHAYPKAFNQLRVKLGVIYVIGNLTLAIKSLVRRHFISTQVKVLSGDKLWVDRQTYSWNNTDIPLFRSAPKWEKEEDLRSVASSEQRQGVEGNVTSSPPEMRMQRIFSRAGHLIAHSSHLSVRVCNMRCHWSSLGQYQADPIGLVKHFDAWREFATSARSTFPVLFVNLNNMSDLMSLAVLARFLNVSAVNPKLLEYKPSKRKHADLLQVRCESYALIFLTDYHI